MHVVKIVLENVFSLLAFYQSPLQIILKDYYLWQIIQDYPSQIIPYIQQNVIYIFNTNFCCLTIICIILSTTFTLSLFFDKLPVHSHITNIDYHIPLVLYLY